MAEVVFHSVTKVFDGNVIAVDALDQTVEDGEFMVLVGPSGCGKTTALRMVAGLDKPTSGTIEIGGRIVNDLSPKARDIAMVFQSYALYPHMSVEQNIAFGLKMHGFQRREIARRVQEVSAMLDLGGL
ncbi:MAG TPA: ABC transporter ATP-binding protein, partial [Actinomycetota bacterium]|nr:ABC transporter ATP-binding protein [Actinomycetota bacterium]